MAARLEDTLGLAAISAAVAASHPIQPAQTVSAKSDSFHDILRAEESKPDAKESVTGDENQKASTRESEKDQRGETSGRTDRSTDAETAGSSGETAQKAEKTDARKSASPETQLQTKGGNATKSGLSLSAGVSASEALNLKAAIAARAAETQVPAISLKTEQIALDNLSGTNANAATGTTRSPAAPVSQTPVEKEPSFKIQTTEPKVESTTESAARNTAETIRGESARSEIRTENGASRIVQEAKTVSVTTVHSAAGAETAVRDVRVQQPFASVQTVTQLQEMHEKIMSRIESGVQAMLDRGESRMTLRLQPPELGRVLVEIQTGGSAMEIKVSTENLAVREVVLANLDELKTNLQAAGLEVGHVSVEVGSGSNDLFGEPSDSRNPSGRHSRNGGGDDPDGASETSATPVLQSLKLHLGRSVNLLI
jgi:flagellar hook-length control protein FliK